MPTDTQQAAKPMELVPEQFDWDVAKGEYVASPAKHNTITVEAGPDGRMILAFPCGARVDVGDLRSRRKTAEWFVLLDELPDGLVTLLPASAFTDGGEGNYIICRNGRLELWDDAYSAASSGASHPWMRFDLKEVVDLFTSRVRSR